MEIILFYRIDLLLNSMVICTQMDQYSDEEGELDTSMPKRTIVTRPFHNFSALMNVLGLNKPSKHPCLEW